ncbi:hexameric tyrosine-coordinated heme protein [Arenibacter latericius]|uniref:hexameric tyrosine-coordinated heme protein n=1 Tax=Arenibacter latericius TaxID=86104 RepID=UPI000409B5C0|nr:hexameric tyrosine-coordinated heme protein [Arenibacter latericius]MDX1363325.1 hexameric tyrosine-coordinated heme protein [Arenibacter latericius]
MKKYLIIVILFFAYQPLMLACDHCKELHSNNVEEITNDEKPSESMEPQQNYLPSLITATPFEGRQLAITLARKSIAEIQTDPETRKKLRSDYATDTQQLIASAQIIAIEFQTIAAANNYWRK